MTVGLRIVTEVIVIVVTTNQVIELRYELLLDRVE